MITKAAHRGIKRYHSFTFESIAELPILPRDPTQRSNCRRYDAFRRTPFEVFISLLLQAFFAGAACPIPGSYFDGLYLKKNKASSTTVSFNTKVQCHACLAATVGALDAQAVQYLDLSQLAQLSEAGSSAPLASLSKECSGTYSKALKKQVGAVAAKKGKKVSKCFTSGGFPLSDYPNSELSSSLVQ